MKFWKSIAYKDSSSENPFSIKNNLISLTNNIMHMDKQSLVEHHINFPSEKADNAQLAKNCKRNFKEAFKNGEAGIKKLFDRIEKPSFPAPFLLCNWGDDLMFSATEWDVSPIYSVESHSAETQYNFADELEGLKHYYQDYNPQNDFFFENNNLELMHHQTAYFDAPSRIGFSGAGDFQVPDSQYFGESSITANLPFNSLIDREPTVRLEEESYGALASNIRPTQPVELRELQEVKQSSNKVFQISHSLHINSNLEILHETKRKNNDPERKYEPQRSQSSSKVTVRIPHTISKNAKYPLGMEESKIKKLFSLFFETLDNYSDNVPSGHSRRRGKTSWIN
ncbi:hypothetical protein BY996DRAFT_7962303 [Phakopsora pachyrhizi]|nr:hypothetical protein BY996DRAFT_7962303 [Phakopsora pachyrhizi]